jgi:hypothetical protein
MNHQILLRAGINPRNVLHMEEVQNICPWCTVECGTLACLLPCEHEFCENCINTIVDLDYERCPVCDQIYEDFSMDTNLS